MSKNLLTVVFVPIEAVAGIERLTVDQRRFD